MKNFLTILIITLTLSACVTAGKAEKDVFIVNINSPQISMGGIEVQFDKTFPLSGLRKVPITLSYFPKEDAVCLQYRVDLITYNQFWSRSGRTAFINALAQYKDAYEARSINSRGGSKTKREYGAVEGYLVWQTHRFGIQAKSGVKIEIGYSFKSNAPYFATNQREAHFESPTTRDDDRKTVQISTYYTRAQAEELAILFDQQFLQGLVSGSSVNIDAVVNLDEDAIQADEY